MDVTCPACAARYHADAEKLRGKTARMRCKACNTVWLVAGPSNETPSGEARRVRRNSDRENRDLFASKPLDMGSVKQTLRPPPPAYYPENNAVAARNETSVLFTVEALKGTARVKTPEPSESPLSSGRVEDDEGIIDLNALASVPPKAGTRPVAPLFSEPPPAAFTRDASASGSAEVMTAGGFFGGKRMIAGIAAAAVAVVLLGIGVASAFKGEEPVARAQATMIAPVTPPPPAPTAAPKPPEPAPAPATSTASTSSDDESASSTPAKGKKGKGKGKASGGAKLASGGGKSPNMSKVASSGVAPVKPAADKCGCKGDFNCILRCTATGK